MKYFAKMLFSQFIWFYYFFEKMPNFHSLTKINKKPKKKKQLKINIEKISNNNINKYIGENIKNINSYQQVASGKWNTKKQDLVQC